MVIDAFVREIHRFLGTFTILAPVSWMMKSSGVLSVIHLVFVIVEMLNQLLSNLIGFAITSLSGVSDFAAFSLLYNLTTWLMDSLPGLLNYFYLKDMP